MNKFKIIAIVMVVIIVAGIAYSFTKSAEDRPVTTGKVREVTVTAIKDEWRFEPEELEAELGDKIVMTVVNEDNYDHGIGIDAFGVSQRMPANETIKLEFIVTRPGDFPFYCSVPCGDCDVAGEHRDHYSMVGKLHVKSLITETN